MRAGSGRGLALAAFLWLLTVPAWGAWAAEPVFRDLSPDSQQATVGSSLLAMLEVGHYKSVKLNDEISRRILASYLKTLDPGRSYFHARDIEEFDVLATRFDDLIKARDLKPAFWIYNRYRQRMAERLRLVSRMVDAEFDSFDFKKEESLVRRHETWADSIEDLRARWRRQVKADVLNRLLAGTARDEIRDALGQRYANQLKRLAQSNSSDVFRVYINVVLRAIDPHSEYFPPHQSENFNIHLSLSLEGIGAVLQADGERVKVVRLVVGGPADKAGELRPGDHIVAVGQGEDGEMVDILGMRLDQVVTLIRGPKETTVRLEIIPQVSPTKERKVIRIVRNKVTLEDQQASSRILEVDLDGRKEKIGVIRLPTFYVDFAALRAGDRNYKRTSGDVARLLAELKKAKVSGVIIDLRNNSGGALQQAIELVGLFIERGPVVQVRNSQGLIRVHADTNPGIAYRGPLAVLVNRLSASASEIVAGAFQDYGRGLVLGVQTFGKGTVQTLIPVKEGHLKLTQAKYYRISGDSTQKRGVVPDIQWPGAVDKQKVGEDSLDNALPWDSIDSARYSTVADIAPYLETLTARHGRRASADPDFAHLMARIARLQKERGETAVSLNEETRRARKRNDEILELKSENTRRRAKGEEPFATFAELEAYNEKRLADPSTVDDAILDEAAHVLADFIELTQAPSASSASRTGS